MLRIISCGILNRLDHTSVFRKNIAGLGEIFLGYVGIVDEQYITVVDRALVERTADITSEYCLGCLDNCIKLIEREGSVFCNGIGTGFGLASLSIAFVPMKASST